jgi:hypothetical protein
MARHYRLRALATAGLLFVGSVAPAQVVLSTEKIAPPSVADRTLLKDAIDIHSHVDPDSFGPHSGQAARSLDIVDMANRAKKAGMRGFVAKQHYDQTAQLAYIAMKEVPGVEVFGQLCMNLTVGGLNPYAIEHFAEVKGGRARIVSMPTWDSENNVREAIREGRGSMRKFVAVSKDGELLPETKAVIAAIAAAKDRDSGATLALATGHITPAEGLMVLREARKQGITRMVVTHAAGPPVNMSLAQMKEAVSLGAYIEFVGGFVIGSRAVFTVQQYADMMRALGTDHVILSSDTGQVNRPFPDDTIALVAGQLKAKGLTAAELHQIMVENPAKLLGIPQPGKG